MSNYSHQSSASGVCWAFPRALENELNRPMMVFQQRKFLIYSILNDSKPFSSIFPQTQQAKQTNHQLNSFQRIPRFSAAVDSPHGSPGRSSPRCWPSARLSRRKTWGSSRAADGSGSSWKREKTTTACRLFQSTQSVFA